MKYLDILVHVDNSKACAARIAAAIALAERHGARLHGVCVVPPENLALYGEAAVAADVIQAVLDAVDQELASAQAKFRDAVAKTKLVTECTAVKGHAASLVAEAARRVNLAVVGQPDEDDPACTSDGVAASVAFGAGAGVLVHPAHDQFAAIGTRVLLAWDGSREAQRAVQAALPLLVDAEQVEVLSVMTEDTSDRDGAEPARGICERLGRHGVQAQAHHVSATDDEVGNILLSRCQEVRADLLVLGAYGHSRLREFLLGGVTRRVLQGHTLPVLLAH